MSFVFVVTIGVRQMRCGVEVRGVVWRAVEWSGVADRSGELIIIMIIEGLGSVESCELSDEG